MPDFLIKLEMKRVLKSSFFYKHPHINSKTLGKIIQMSHRKSILYHLHILDPKECNDIIDDYDC